MICQYDTNCYLEVTHTYIKRYDSSVSLENSITCPHSEPKKQSPQVPKLILEIHFNIILPLMTMTSKNYLLFSTENQISKFVRLWKWNTKDIVKWNFTISFLEHELPPPHTQNPKTYHLFSHDWWKYERFWNFILYIDGSFNFNTVFFSSTKITRYTCLNTGTSFTFHTTHTVL